MTREEHLAFCKKCTNREMNIEQGLVCSLTGSIATFETTCSSFNLDPSVKIEVDNEERLGMDEIKEKLPLEVFEQMKLEENLTAATFSGITTAVLAAALWGLVTVALEIQFGFMPILIGTAVGYAIRKTGNGVTTIFGILGASISLFGCLLGNFFSLVGFVSLEADLNFFLILLNFDYSYIPEIMSETFQPIDILFYGLAITSGYKLSFRAITEQDIQTLRNIRN